MDFVKIIGFGVIIGLLLSISESLHEILKILQWIQRI